MGTELARLRALLDYRVLDTAPEAAFDRLTALAADLFDVPIALVSLIDTERQWFKSRHGLDVCEAPRDHAFCTHAIALEPGSVMVVEDAALDPRFATNPLVTGAPHIRFYAGAVLTSPGGENLGTLCIVDTKPRREGLSLRETARLRALAGAVIDALETTRAGRESAEQSRLLSLAESVSGVGHWRYVIKTGELRWSDEVYRIHGVSRDSFDPAYNDAIEFFGPEGRETINALVKQSLATGDGYHFEMELRRADGETRIVVSRAVCELDETGAVEAMFGVFQDVTVHVEALRQAEAAAVAKAEFLANMSHELRTPLTSIIGFSGLLKQSGSLAPDERRYADRIQTASEALLSVINDILDVSKLEAGGVELDPRPFSVMDLSREAMDLIEPQALKKGLVLNITGGEGLDRLLLGDGPRLRQVMLNFLSNAAKFTAHGSITLDVRGEPDETGGVCLAVTVTDTGVGFAPEQAERLFDRFVQADGSTARDHGGTGLGLTISQRLIQLMGGQIGAIGRPGKGAAFWFTVPLSPVTTLVAPPTSVSAPFFGSGRVLLADDAAANRELVSTVLGQLGLRVETVEDGAAAVDAVSRGTFDLVLMDIQMPGMDGLAATRAIRGLGGDFAHLPIVALTANVQPAHLAAYRVAGLDAHIAKPIDFAALIALLDEYLPTARLEQCA
ncbi:ATP-binding protein [Caulobacter sp.]|uniref:GAF domain-containing hybrid sensor histidine kinase/response regulator n=1 Tax=Caulobacter sp. TaxID=78 RepID=UPI003BA872DC